MNEVEERKRLLENLIYIKGSVQESIKVLDGYDTGHDGEELVVLAKEDIKEILNRYLMDKITAEDIFLWADAIELRGDICFGTEDDESGVVFDIISYIATPELEGEISKDKAEEFIQRIEIA